MKRVRPRLIDYEDRVRRLIQLTREMNSTPILITQPLVYGPVIDDVTGIDLNRIKENIHDLSTNSSVYWRILEMYNDVVRRVGPDEGVLVIDLARNMPKSTRYYFDKMHFGNDGADKSAAIVAASLCPYLKDRFPEFFTGIACPAE